MMKSLDRVAVWSSALLVAVAVVVALSVKISQKKEDFLNRFTLYTSVSVCLILAVPLFLIASLRLLARKRQRAILEGVFRAARPSYPATKKRAYVSWIFGVLGLAPKSRIIPHQRSLYRTVVLWIVLLQVLLGVILGSLLLACTKPAAIAPASAKTIATTTESTTPVILEAVAERRILLLEKIHDVEFNKYWVHMAVVKCKHDIKKQKKSAADAAKIASAQTKISKEAEQTLTGVA